MPNVNPIIWQTKLHRPAVTRTLVKRPRLLDLLNYGINHQLILVCAPAGFGKTTLVSSWIESLEGGGEGESNRLPAAWLSLEESESDIHVFVQYVIAALRTIFDDACVDTAKLLRAQQRLPLGLIAASLINEIMLLPGNFVLVLDNYHKIRGEAITNLLNDFLLHWPEPLHLVLISRTNPPLPLARLRTNDQLTEIRSSALRFNKEETSEFLNNVLQTPLSEPLLMKLEERIEGWAGALRLTALTMRTIGNLERMLAILDSSHEMLEAYLIDEILMKQVPAIQAFLLRTSILDRFSAQVSESVMGEPDPAWTAQACIDWLEREELFVVPLDDRRHWFRYHHLFQDALRLRLAVEMTPELVQDLHRRAATGFEREGMVDEALKHALLAQDLDLAAGLMARAFRELLNLTDWRTMERWLGLLPEELVQSRPWLLLIRAWTLHFSWQLSALSKILVQIESLIGEEGGGMPGADEFQFLRAQLLLLKAQDAYYSNQVNQSMLYCQEVLARLPKEWLFARGGAFFYLGLCLQASGQEEAARRMLLDAYEGLETKSNALALRILMALCFNYHNGARYEELRQSAVVLLQQGTRGGEVVAAAWAHFFLGVVRYQWGELNLARRHFTKVIGDSYLVHQVALRNARFGLAKIHQASGQSAEANYILEVAGQTDIEQIGFKEESTLSMQAWLMLQQGNLDGAFRWADAYTAPMSDRALGWLEEPHFTRARILLARGAMPDVKAALHILDWLHEIAERTHNKRVNIEILTVRALGLAAQGRNEEAEAELAQAVKLSKAGGFVQVFVEQGPQMQKMLAGLVERDQSVGTIQRILAAFPDRPGLGSAVEAPAQPAPAASQDYPAPIELLTPREKQILAELREPVSLRQIALRLDISYATVKRHTINAYGKLGVNSRWDAVARAIELGILPSR